MTSLSEKTINNSLTRSNSAEIAGFAMPSDTYETLTSGPTGSTYTAPANGWFSVTLSPGVSGGNVQIGARVANTCVSTTSGYINASCPAKKGDIATLWYGGGTIAGLVFCYAEGEI